MRRRPIDRRMKRTVRRSTFISGAACLLGRRILERRTRSERVETRRRRGYFYSCAREGRHRCAVYIRHCVSRVCVFYWQSRAVRTLPIASGVSAGLSVAGAFSVRGVSWESGVTPSVPVTVALGLCGRVRISSVGERDASEPTMPVGERGATEPRGGVVCALVSALVAAGRDTFPCVCAC